MDFSIALIGFVSHCTIGCAKVIEEKTRSWL